MNASPHGPEDIPVVLSGYGPVGRAFVGHLSTEGDRLAAQYGVRVRVGAIRGRSTEVLRHDDESVPPRSAWLPLSDVDDVLQRTRARVLLQAVPSSAPARDRAAEEALVALRRGVHVVTATKSHLLSHWTQLSDTARTHGASIRISGATGAALPAGDLARAGVRGLDCDTIRGCPNGTVTFVLDRLRENASLEDAVREAQRRGIAEADPTADLTGEDAATKMRLLAALLWGWDPAATRVDLEPLAADVATRAREAEARGRRLRAVAIAARSTPLQVRVQLEETSPGDPLFSLDGPEKAVVFRCSDAGNIVASGGRSSPLGAALALLKDTLELTVPRVGFA